MIKMQNAQVQQPQVVIKSDGEYFLHFDLAELYSHVSIDVRWQLA